MAIDPTPKSDLSDIYGPPEQDSLIPTATIVDSIDSQTMAQKPGTQKIGTKESGVQASGVQATGAEDITVQMAAESTDQVNNESAETPQAPEIDADFEKRLDDLIDEKKLMEAFGYARQTLNLALRMTPHDQARAQNSMAKVLLAASRADDAVGYARQARQLDPDNLDYGMMLGLALRQCSRHQEAANLFLALGNANLDHAGIWNNLGLTLTELQRYPEAEQAFEKSLEADRDFAQAWNNLGSMRFNQKRPMEGLTCFNKAIEHDPKLVDAWVNRGQVLATMEGEEKRALSSFTQAAELAPDRWSTWAHLSRFLTRAGRHRQAMETGLKSLAFNANQPELLHSLAVSCETLGEAQRASMFLRQLLTFNPDQPKILLALSQKALQLAAPVEALCLAQRAVALTPHDAAAHYMLGSAFYRMHRYEDALQAFGVANRLVPDNNRPALYAIAQVLLSKGQFRPGFSAYEARLGMSAYKLSYQGTEVIGRMLTADSETAGRRLLLLAEEDPTNALQFARYIPRLKVRWPDLGQVSVACSGDLAGVLQQVPGIEKIHTPDLPPRPADYDLCLPIGSLPNRIGITHEGLQKEVGYIPPLPGGRIALPKQEDFTLRVGLSWRGDYESDEAIYSAIPFHFLAELLNFQDIGFYPLSPSSDDEKAQLPAQLFRTHENLINLPFLQSGLIDMARAVDALDLVITVDNVIAHLAGGMGKPCWTLLSYSCGWRWHTLPEETPWYPNTRLFRQLVLGDWSMVMRQVKQTLVTALEAARLQDSSEDTA